MVCSLAAQIPFTSLSKVKAEKVCGCKVSGHHFTGFLSHIEVMIALKREYVKKKIPVRISSPNA